MDSVTIDGHLSGAGHFYRQYTDDPSIAAEVRTLPQMTCSGWVRDLQANTYEFASILIASCACKSVATGHFYGEERMSKTTRKCLCWRFDRLKKNRLHKVQAVSSVLHFL